MDFDVKNAAKYLSLDENRIRTLLRNKEIQGEKVGGKWTIKKKDLDLFKNTPPAEYMDVTQAVQITEYTRSHIQNSIRKGKLPARKDPDDKWIFKKKDFEAFLQAKKIPDEYISLMDAVKKLKTDRDALYNLVKKGETQKVGTEIIIPVNDLKKLKQRLIENKRGKKVTCASLYFRKFGRKSGSKIKGPYLEARSGKYISGRKILGQVPLKNVRSDTVEKAKKELIKTVRDLGITKIHDNVKIS